MYAYRNKVLDDNGRMIGQFSDHAAAQIAIFHVENPEYDTLYDVLPDEDIAEEEKMKERIRFGVR